MTRHVLAASLLLAGACYTDSRGGSNVCVPGHDGLCPAPEIVHRHAPVSVLTTANPVVLGREFDDYTSPNLNARLPESLEEIAIDSRARNEFPFDDQVHDSDLNGKGISVACTTFCAAVWINDEAYVVSAVRDGSDWSTPLVHDGKTNTPFVAISGDDVLVAWMRTNAGYGDLEVRHLDRAGTLLGGTTVVTGVDLYSGSVTGGPAGFLATWRSVPPFPAAKSLVAQSLGLDGVPVDTPFEVLAMGSYIGTGFNEPPSAFFDGTFHVVNDGYSSPWAVIDPVTRSIEFSGPFNDARGIRSITPANPGALVSIGTSTGVSAQLVRVQNAAVASSLELSSAPSIGATTDGFLLAYRNNKGLVIEKRDAALAPIEEPRTIAEDYDLGNGCAAGHGAHGASTIVLLALALSRAARRRPRSRR